MAEAATQEILKKEAEPLFSRRRKKIVADPLNEENPITVQVLGICSALAVTVKMEPTLIMGISVIAVIAFSNLTISLIRNFVPNRIRIIVQLAVVATMVSLVAEVLKAYNYPMYKVLGAFVGLIITNCIVMGRLEAFAMGNKPYDSILDGLGSGMGYAWIILAVAFFRELLGSGSVFDVAILNSEFLKNIGIAYTNNSLMVDSVGAFMILGVIIWIQRSKTGYVEH
jgi:Na+-transporting NADH:ubiquinone oxidoreductase subunit D